MSQKQVKKFRKAVKMEAKIFYTELLRTRSKWIPKFIYKWILNKMLKV